MMRIVLMGVMSALFLGASLNLGAVNDLKLGPGPWGRLESVLRYPNDGPVRYATVLYNNVGSLYGKNPEDIKEAVASSQAQKKWVAADTDAGIVPADTMTQRIQKTGKLIKKDPTVAGAPSLYAQVAGVNTALGGTGSTWNRVDKVGALIQKDTADTSPHDGVAPTTSLAARARTVRSWVQTDGESDAFVVDPDSDPVETGTLNDSTYTRMERVISAIQKDADDEPDEGADPGDSLWKRTGAVAQLIYHDLNEGEDNNGIDPAASLYARTGAVAEIIHHDTVSNGDNGVSESVSLAARARTVRSWVQTNGESAAFVVDPDSAPVKTGTVDDSTYTRVIRVNTALGGSGSTWARVDRVAVKVLEEPSGKLDEDIGSILNKLRLLFQANLGKTLTSWVDARTIEGLINQASFT
ncbi:hypothetical protein [Candidatus Hepatobacter penaei]|uniref:hypothetical protein n=1 Tax=Candidatus Hepatobacter penaei TaxID=1274402 RepID=UPI0012E0089D|nr:hypothetical protein [Candidatus Hepatobacter penaei]